MVCFCYEPPLPLRLPATTLNWRTNERPNQTKPCKRIQKKIEINRNVAGKRWQSCHFDGVDCVIVVAFVVCWWRRHRGRKKDCFDCRFLYCFRSQHSRVRTEKKTKIVSSWWRRLVCALQTMLSALLPSPYNRMVGIGSTSILVFRFTIIKILESCVQ